MTAAAPRRGGKTAQELMRELESDPEFLAQQARRDRDHAVAVARNRTDAAPLLAHLAAAGFPVSSVAELKQQRDRYRAAIPVLLAWLPRLDNPDVKRDVVGALGVKWAAGDVVGPLLAEFERVKDPTGEGLRWTIGWALSVVATDEALGEILRLAGEKRYGRARQMLVAALGNMKDPRAVAAAREFLRDDLLVAPAIAALRKLNAREARAEVEPFLAHPDAFVRTEARKAIAKFDRANGGRAGR
ncbi:MAG: HEAT repeat domain-containing protein [Actinomycetota bacterium]